jgi:hypothetical protein
MNRSMKSSTAFQDYEHQLGLIEDQNSLEGEVRKMRDRLYELSISDSTWAGIAHNWMRPDSVDWLKNELLKSSGLP